MIGKYTYVHSTKMSEYSEIGACSVAIQPRWKGVARAWIGAKPARRKLADLDGVVRRLAAQATKRGLRLAIDSGTREGLPQPFSLSTSQFEVGVRVEPIDATGHTPCRAYIHVCHSGAWRYHGEPLHYSRSPMRADVWLRAILSGTHRELTEYRNLAARAVL